MFESSNNYSVMDYKFEYLHSLRTIVIPYLRKYEFLRYCLLVLAILLVIALEAGIYFLLDYALRNPHIELLLKPFRHFIIMFIVGAPFVLWKCIQSSFEYMLKGKIMPTLMETLPGFEWNFVPDDNFEQKIMNAKIFPLSKKIKQYYYDNFMGNYRDVYMDFSSGYYQTTRFVAGEFEFNGPVIRIKMNKPFIGATVLRPNTIKDSCTDLANAGLQKVELEDIEFNKKFLVYSTDQVEARYLLTTAFIDRFKNISKAYNTKRIFCSFYEDYLYIAPYSKQDVFSLFGLTKSITDLRPYNVMFEQVASVLSLVDYLKLDKRLGL